MKMGGTHIIITISVFLGGTVLSSVLTCEVLWTEWPGSRYESSPEGQTVLRGSQVLKHTYKFTFGYIKFAVPNCKFLDM